MAAPRRSRPCTTRGLVRFLADGLGGVPAASRPTHDVVARRVRDARRCAPGWDRRVRAASVGARLGWWCFETTTPLTAGTYEAARSAVDVRCRRHDVVLGGERLAYGLCRPPGHHATTALYGGYCFFNNAAIAAASPRHVDRRRRSPCSTSTTTTATAPSRSSTSATTSRSSRCTATRSAPIRTSPATPTRPAPGGARHDVQRPARRRHRRRRLPRRARPGAGRRRRVRAGAGRRVARASTPTSATRCATSP